MLKTAVWKSFLGRAVAVAVVAACAGSAANAAVLTLGTPTKYPAGPTLMPAVDLDSGNIDWAYWANGSSTPVASPVAPTNRKSGGTASISNLSAVGSNQTLRGSTTGTVANFTYANGTTTSSGTVSGTSFTFNATLNDATQGESFTLAGDPTTTRTAVLYLGGFGDTGKLTLTLNGATTVVDTSQVFNTTAPKAIVAYPVTYRPDNAGDLLTIQYLPTTITDTNSHVGVMAVTVAVPEPASIAGVGIIGLALLGRRRRRMD